MYPTWKGNKVSLCNLCSVYCVVSYTLLTHICHLGSYFLSRMQRKRTMIMTVWAQSTRILTIWWCSLTPPCRPQCRPWARLASNSRVARSAKRRSDHFSASHHSSRAAKAISPSSPCRRRLSWRKVKSTRVTCLRRAPVALGRKSGVSSEEQFCLTISECYICMYSPRTCVHYSSTCSTNLSKTMTFTDN